MQQFLDDLCRAWGYSPPMRLPVSLIMTAAWFCEAFGVVAGTPSPLTRDFIRIGRIPYWGDTTRTCDELIPHLEYPSLASGLATLRDRA